MSTLIPTASACHQLLLPPIEKDDRLNLNVRTGSASTLYNSLVLTFGGLTVGLELYEWTIQELFNTYQTKIVQANAKQKQKHISSYLSGELFYLKLLEKTWARVHIDPSAPRPKPRMFHEVCALNNCIYIFGGLVVPEGSGDRIPTDPSQFLVPTNDLWEFNLESSKWKLLHDGANFELDSSVPMPRYNLKMTAISSLKFVDQKDHFGILIAGGKGKNSQPIYDNYVFDLVNKKYVNMNPIQLKVTTGDREMDKARGLDNFCSNDQNNLSVNYSNSIIVTFAEEIENQKQHTRMDSTTSLSNKDPNANKRNEFSSSSALEESIIVYSPIKNELNSQIENPLISFKIGKSIRNGRVLPTHRKREYAGEKSSNIIDPTSKAVNKMIPFNLRYPTGGLFGQNLVLTGFLPNEYDISIFIFNKPTGKWSRLNIFCNHDYGSHRFWGGFAWQSHHKVVLIGNYLTSRTTSSVRFFTVMITVSLPVTNILASSELAGSKGVKRVQRTSLEDSSDASTCSSLLEGSTDEEDDDNLSANSNDLNQSGGLLRKPSRKVSVVSHGSEKNTTTISFSEYVHYAAPKTNFTKVRSVFPPAAITLGRNAFDRYGDLISDFELVSANGDRIPVSLAVLMERWGRYFIQLLARGYVKAVDKFESDQASGKTHHTTANTQRMRSSKSSSTSSSNNSAKDQSTTNANITGYFTSNKNKKSSVGSVVSGSSSEGDSSSDKKEESKPKHSYHITIPVPPSKAPPKEAPQFRLPFQETGSTSSLNSTGSQTGTSPVRASDQQDSSTSTLAELNAVDRPPLISVGSAYDPHQVSTRKDSVSSGSSSLLTSHLQDIPPQLPLPSEQIPAVPATPTSFRNSSSRKNSSDLGSPRASLIHTLTVLRNIPASKSPKGSPFASPRASVSNQGSGSGNGNTNNDLYSSPVPNLRPAPAGSSSSPLSNKFKNAELVLNEPTTPDVSSGERKSWGNSQIDALKAINISSSVSSVDSQDRDKKYSSISSSQSESPSNASSGKDSNEEEFDKSRSISEEQIKNPPRLFDNALLNFENIDEGKFRMEPSLIPRKLYVPFSSSTLKAFCEYLYTGQVGNKWLLSPTTLDNLAIAKFFKVPLLYDLISEVLFGIIGRKEAFIIREGNQLKKRYYKLLELTKTDIDPTFSFPLDEYEGFKNTVDDGYFDIALLKKTSNIHKNSSASAISSKKKKSFASSMSKYSYLETGAGESDVTPGPESRAESIAESPEHEIEHEGLAEPEVEQSTPQQDLQETDTAQDLKQEEAKGEGSKSTEEETDESEKKTTSTSEEDTEFELGFLNNDHNPSFNFGPRSKSVFDKLHATQMEFQSSTEDANIDDEKEKLSLTLEQLVSPDSPIPSDYLIDLIYETAAIVLDMKLMLRAANVRQMNRAALQSKDELGDAIARLTKRYQAQVAAEEIARSSQPEPVRSVASTRMASPSDSMGGDLKQSMSTTSLSGLSKASLLEKSKSNASFRGIGGIGGFTPFKQSKTDPKLGNKELDKRITKLIKKDEKEKLRTERERQQHEKIESDRAKRAAKKEAKATHDPKKPAALLSRTSSKLNLDSDTSSIMKKKHSLFHLPGGKNGENSPRDDYSFESIPMTRTASSTGSVNLTTSRKSEKKRHFFTFKRK